MDRHETPLSSLCAAPLGAVPVWIVQLAPSHLSASAVATPELLKDSPTAVHAVADEHDTPCKYVYCPPAGLGTVTYDQVEPFHRNAYAS